MGLGGWAQSGATQLNELLGQKFNYLCRKVLCCNMKGNERLEITLQTCRNIVPRILEDGEIKSHCIDFQNRSTVDDYTEASPKQ